MLLYPPVRRLVARTFMLLSVHKRFSENRRCVPAPSSEPQPVKLDSPPSPNETSVFSCSAAPASAGLRARVGSIRFIGHEKQEHREGRTSDQPRGQQV